MRKPSNKKKASFKGPFQNNPNLQIQNVRASMRPESDGPTVDTFSSIDSTTNFLGSSPQDNTIQPKTRTKRPTKAKPKKFSIYLETVVLTIFGFVAIGIGIIVYNHSNNLVSIGKDIDYLKDDTKEIKQDLENTKTKVNEMDKKIEMLNQKIDFTTKKK